MLDSSHVIHVAKTGNDANSGHAGQHPVNLANDAVLTVGQGVANAVAGDGIIIWPGTYDEQVDASALADLRVAAALGWGSKIINTSDTYVLKVGANAFIEGLYIENDKAMASNIVGLQSDSDNIEIYHCYVKTEGQSVVLNGTANSIIGKGSVIIGREYGVRIAAGTQLLIKESSVAISGWTICAATAIVLSNAQLIIKDSRIVASMPSPTITYPVTGIYATAAEVLIKNSYLSVGLPGEEYQFGVLAGVAKVDIIGSIIHNANVAVNNYSLYHGGGGSISVADSIYDTSLTYGVISQGMVAPEMAQGAPPAEATPAEILNYFYRAFRNKVTNDGDVTKVFNDAKDEVLFKASTTKAGGVFTKDEYVSGP